jgi:hypothetical protein
LLDEVDALEEVELLGLFDEEVAFEEVEDEPKLLEELLPGITIFTHPVKGPINVSKINNLHNLFFI